MKRIEKDMGKEVADEFIKTLPLTSGKKERPWLGWAPIKKQKVAEALRNGTYKALQVRLCCPPSPLFPPTPKVQLGKACPPLSTIKGWQGVEGRTSRRVGRPTLLTFEEERTVLDSFKHIRHLGAVVDSEGLAMLATSTLSRTRSVLSPSSSSLFFSAGTRP